MLEVALTRILSVVMWYHFAFFTISVALFGLSASGLVVYLIPRRFRSERALPQAWMAAAALAIAVPLCFALFAANPAQAFLTGFLRRAGESGLGLGTIAQVGVLYLSAVIPFFLGGMVGSILFRHFGEASSRLYAWDLIGAGLGCLATIPILDWVGGPSAMAAVALLAAVGAAVLGLASGDRRRAAIGGLIAIAAAFLLALNPTTHWLHLKYFRGREEPDVVFEKWNSFSRVAVRETPSGTHDSLLIEIDSASNTMISRWDGRVESLAPLRNSLIGVQYALLEKPAVFVIGSGGGVDLLTAVANGARSVTAVEVNPIIVGLMQKTYAEFSGGIYNRPEIRVVNDEARSFIRRSHQKYDVIQAGYIDTYAATAAGAFSLTENTLYTVEAYEDYLSHLSPNGIVAIQRYFEDPPQQSIRLISLALAALKQRGDLNPAAHIVVVREGDRASVLVKNSEFTAAEVAHIEEHIAPSGFELIAAPGRAGVGLYGQLLNTRDFESVIRGYQLDISPVTDDRPFFFYVVKPSQFWRGLLLHTGEFVNARAVFLLTSLMLVALILAVLMVLLPALIARPRPPAAAIPAMVYFGALGLGFMLVEIGMLQRLMLFLGHPTLALGVVLTTILISAGLGSFLTRRVTLERSDLVLRRFLIAVLVAVALVAFLLPPMFRAFIGMERAGRIWTAIEVLFPVGFLMGTAMPLGLRRLADGRAELIPWAWAVNGAASVLGSVLAMVVAINNGFTATLVLGGIVYAIALVLIGATRAKGSEA
jgi:predicted membrane-bound spermidine synthase